MENPTRNNIKFSYCIIFSHYANLDSEFFLVRADLRAYFCYSRENIKNKFKCSLRGLYRVIRDCIFDIVCEIKFQYFAKPSL